MLKIKPKDFWDMTILEILALSKESSVTTELVTKKDLEYLIRKFS
ncbi:MAG: phage tail assembly chaperone [Alphaproteobacteria bacterium]|nr:phage tail assembly chaperone [Alphaproteobacteria bacterium]